MADQAQPFASAVGFASSDDEAAKRYEHWKTRDPFPDEIPPALLNSGDIADYVAATGMVHPFVPDKRKLKSASYEVDLLGKCVAFVGAGHKDIQISQIGKEQEFILRKNEIAFVQLEPKFRLPQYIALRFNLKIRHVYRGLLLGTGPLVDPGFAGYLWIPLHNLTSNEYVFRGGEGLVWMEFTKLSPLLPDQSRDVRQKYFAPFPAEKNERKDILDYLDHAAKDRSIRSSIPVLFEQAAKSAEDAHQEVRNVRLVFSLGAAALLVTIVLAAFSLITSVRDRAEDALRKADVMELRIENLEKKIATIRGTGSGGNKGQ